MWAFYPRHPGILLNTIVVLWLWAIGGPGVHAAGDGRFHLGVITERIDEPDHALSQYSQLRDYLRDRLREYDIDVGPLVIGRDVPDLGEKLARGQVDMVIEGVFPTLAMQRRTGELQPALLVWRKEQREYFTVFFSREDGPIETLEDLRGQRLTFESPRSTSAYAIPRGFLLHRGFTLVPAAGGVAAAGAIRYVFAGAEINQAYWVLHGKAEAGAFNDGDWQRLAPGVQRGLRIFARTPPILRWLVSFHDDVAPQVRAAVEAVLLEMHEDPVGSEALRAASDIARFERLDASDMDNLDTWRDVLLVDNP